MRTIRLALFLSFVASTALSAQDVRPVVQDGARSINFTFGGLGTFGLGAAGRDGGISGSYFLSRNAALRVGLQAAYSHSTTPWNGGGAGTDGSSSGTAFGAGADYLSYMSSLTQRVRPYVGVGAYLSSRTSDSKPPLASPVPSGALVETKNGSGGDGLTVGTRAILGAEFFLYPAISLSAEYQVGLFGLTSASDMVRSYQGAPSITTRRGSAQSFLGFSSAGAALHIYF